MRPASVSAKPPLLRVTGFCNVGLLAPDIQEAILEGRQAKGVQLEELMGAMPAEWGEQRRIHRNPSIKAATRSA